MPLFMMQLAIGIGCVKVRQVNILKDLMSKDC